MGTLVNTVNTVGFMGAGIALEYKRRYPEMYDEYKLKCLNGELKIGKLHVWKKEEQWILNFPTKIHYSNQSKIEYINRGLEEFISTYNELEIKSIAFPQLGTQLGGLSWEDEVRPIMYQYLDETDIDIEIYEFDKSSEDNLFIKIRNILKNFSNEEFKEHLNIGIKTANNILDNLDIGITSMQDFEHVRGIGEDALKNIYKLRHFDLKDLSQENYQQTKLSFDDESPNSD